MDKLAERFEPVPSALSRRAAALDPTLLIAGTSSLLAFVLPTPQHNTIAGMPSICPCYLITGYPCPGCGLTRSVVCCAHGLWHQSLLYHPLGPLALAVMLGITFWRVAAFYPPTRVVVSRRVINDLSIAILMLLFVTWGVRFAGFWPLPP